MAIKVAHPKMAADGMGQVDDPSAVHAKGLDIDDLGHRATLALNGGRGRLDPWLSAFVAEVTR